MPHLRFRPRPRLLLTFAAVLAVMLVWSTYRLIPKSRSVELSLRDARAAVSRNDWPAALRFAEEAVRADTQAAEAWLLIARARFRDKHFRGAVAAWERVPLTSPLAVESRLRAAETSLRQLKQLGRAERLYRDARTLAPDRAEAVEGLAQVLAMEGRRGELEACLIRLIQLDAYSNFHLDLLARSAELNVDPQWVPTDGEIAAADVESRCAHARQTLQAGLTDEARSEIESILRFDKECVPAQLLLGQALFSLQADSDLRNWLLRASPRVLAEPDYWRIAWNTARQTREDTSAVRCAWEILWRDPNDSGACLALGQSLHQHGDEERARMFLERADKLDRYATAVGRARRAGSWDAMQQAAELSEALGLFWEAYGWSQLAARLNPQLGWPREILKRSRPRLAQLQLVRTDPAANPARTYNPQQLGLSEFVPHELVRPSLALDELRESLVFRDDSQLSGLQSEYHNGGDCLRTGLQHMYEMTGGGAGVLDFNRDGYPDLYFPDGGDFSYRGTPMLHRDQLWQNLLGEQWRNVSVAAGLDDTGFGQGVCAGDVDGDGYQDLLVLNIGTSVLWRNNGDGTFSRSREFAAVARDSWSISAAIADLNGDSHPDIYLANYLTGDDVFHRVCPDAQGVPRLTCQPLVFAAEPDQLLYSRGDGRFDDRSVESGIDIPEGRGMGVVVGRLTQLTNLEVFVANDATANFHWIPTRSPDGQHSRFQYQDDALLLGTAVDAAGRAQASMGIAAGDADGDGRLDLFATSFEGESNTLYLQHTDGAFTDHSQAFDLSTSSVSLLGFGTQFLDADLDGYLDLIVANGHVNDRRESGSSYQMPPQLWRNLSGKRFHLVPPSDAGGYFQNDYLGRGLATLDWNRDGLLDVAISHLDRPAALLSNQSQLRGRWIMLHCVGTVSARDAVGTIVTVQNGDRIIVRQLTVGDGFASSNQRTLLIGLGPIESESVSVQVNWPEGEVAEYAGIPLDRELVIIEGKQSAIPLMRIQSNQTKP